MPGCQVAAGEYDRRERIMAPGEPWVDVTINPSDIIDNDTVETTKTSPERFEL